MTPAKLNRTQTMSIAEHFCFRKKNPIITVITGDVKKITVTSPTGILSSAMKTSNILHAHASAEMTNNITAYFFGKGLILAADKNKTDTAAVYILLTRKKETGCNGAFIFVIMN